ncbi:NrdH-redoxin [Geobacillus thermoleovorans]|uniref:Glutaredoxin family protein n=1 Tax=Geobacillus proteiniphilus TaxID=860353 RepID=A0ABY9MIF0_9BACL|nr:MULTISPECIES: glutaredoxin family protein [Geobacillus]ASS86231.1 NrdH-redoxin [Geobacillus lituanicus]AMV11213.1 NrdH-redoxin [Geobacillus thermoleovorans]MED4972156.1 glutaredoxin family protein [Geobacillus thermoleovorans]OPX02786.1 NrdH-redoxin [Geobacillus sp. LEMMY01]QCK82245.1 glutaredoxin family protein [Geobacillus kaustophilus NBRC 102445]
MAQVTVYTTTTCPYCVMAKNFLRAQGIPFKEVNVELNPEAARRLVETTGQMGVPQIEINGRWVLGYDPDAIMALWNQANHR